MAGRIRRSPTKRLKVISGCLWANTSPERTVAENFLAETSETCQFWVIEFVSVRLNIHVSLSETPGPAPNLLELDHPRDTRAGEKT
ncbi:hypothetical protein [Caulobacter sp. NIBR1757]|uniref:hypothetical protein n=1 Tax=Caulobacter sp. NIBR1757 TaxID=3016000 RepID=UPI0022F01F3C|nr:hypothetical protein [Caulobacter sp. NIBR1757]